MRLPFSSAGAGHMLRGKYRVYGEGSVHHSGRPCEHGLGLDRHPLIFRHDWPSRWAYWRSLIAYEYHGRLMRRLIWPDGQDEMLTTTIGKPRPMASAKFRWSPFDAPMHKLFGPPFRQVPTVEAGLKPEDSVCDRSDM